MIGIVRGSSVCEYVKETVEGDGEKMIATCRAKRKDQAEEVRTFSVDDAKLAGLWGKQGPWKQYPKRMLQLRARGFAIRDAFADVLKGMASAEEQEDIVRVEKDITPEKASPDAPKELEYYPADDFETNFPNWKDVIESGKRTADQIIVMIESKGRLSDEQKNRIKRIK